jgi:NADH-quinone oxidoreductase subunit F
LALHGDELVRRVEAAGLRGRGGGWYPTARKWRAVRVEGGEPLVVANGAEGEPGSFKDRHLMERRPHDVLRGLVLASRAVGAREAVVYLRGDGEREARALEAALREVDRDGLSVRLVRGSDAYVAGEETALLEGLEGRRPWPRPKPPLPTSVGYRGRPTLVQNVETLSRVPAAVADPEAYRAGETTWVSLWGEVRRPGVYEVRLGTPLRRLIEDQGGGAPDGVGLVLPAGPSAAPLAPEQLDTLLDPDALRDAGSALGTAAVLVVGAAVCPLSVGVSLATFFERESCGQCPPCSVGTASLARILRALQAGGARGKDLRDAAGVTRFVSQHGYCAHGRTAAAAVTGLLQRFSGEVEAHLAGAPCPRGGRGLDPFAEVSPERAAIEAAALA